MCCRTRRSHSAAARQGLHDSTNNKFRPVYSCNAIITLTISHYVAQTKWHLHWLTLERARSFTSNCGIATGSLNHGLGRLPLTQHSSLHATTNQATQRPLRLASSDKDLGRFWQRPHVATATSHKRDTSGVRETPLQIIVYTIISFYEGLQRCQSQSTRLSTTSVSFNQVGKGDRLAAVRSRAVSRPTCEEDDPREQQQDGRRPEQAYNSRVSRESVQLRPARGATRPAFATNCQSKAHGDAGGDACMARHHVRLVPQSVHRNPANTGHPASPVKMLEFPPPLP